MARAIDLDKAIEIIEEKQKELCPVGNYGRHYVYDSDREKYDAWEEIIDALNALSTLTPPNEPRSPHPDGDTSIFACPRCGSGEYLYNEDGVWNNYCGQCGQRIGWGHPPDRRPPEGEDGDATRG